MPNPCETNLVRAADLRETTSLYRHDLARAIAADLPKDAHSLWTLTSASVGPVIGLAARRQAAGFLASGGAQAPDVNQLVRPLFGIDLFETPPQSLPEDLNY